MSPKAQQVVGWTIVAGMAALAVAANSVALGLMATCLGLIGACKYTRSK